MKILFCLFSFLFAIPSFCQQHSIDTVYIKGFRVVQFKKSEIEFSLKNEKLRQEGKSYQKMVDFEQRDFFIPTDDIKLLDTLLKTINTFKQKEFFYLPYRTEVVSFLKKNYNISLDLSNKKKLFNIECNYYLSVNRNTFLYKFYYVEGYSLIVTIENNELNKIKLNISTDEVEKNLKSFKVYFIYDIRKIDCNQELLKGFNVWQYPPACEDL